MQGTFVFCYHSSFIKMKGFSSNYINWLKSPMYELGSICSLTQVQNWLGCLTANHVIWVQSLTKSIKYICPIHLIRRELWKTSYMNGAMRSLSKPNNLAHDWWINKMIQSLPKSWEQQPEHFLDITPLVFLLRTEWLNYKKRRDKENLTQTMNSSKSWFFLPSGLFKWNSFWRLKTISWQVTMWEKSRNSETLLHHLFLRKDWISDLALKEMVAYLQNDLP